MIGTGDRRTTTALARAAIAGLSLAALGAGLAGAALGIAEIRIPALLVYCLVGVGAAPWGLVRALTPPARIVLSGLTTLGLLSLGAAVMLGLGIWWPRQVMIVVAALTALAHVAALRLAARDLAAAQWRPRLAMSGGRRGWTALAAAATGAALCLIPALTHRHVTPGFWGFLAEIGPLWYAGLCLVLLSIALSRSAPEAVMAVCAIALLLVMVGTPALVYDGPRSQSAGKHVDLIEQIRAVHRPNSSLDVYNRWHGFFAAMAWVCDVCGIGDPMKLATAWPVILGPLRVCALRYLAGAVVTSPRMAWTAVSVAVLADPIGADYFSPQSVGFVAGLIVFGIALSGRARTEARAGVAGPRPDGAGPGVARPLGWRRLAAIGFAGAQLTICHQLSPYIVGGVLAVLVLFGQVRPVWTPALVLCPAIGWTLLNRSALEHFLKFRDIGRLANFRPPATEGASDLARMPVVTYTVAALVLGIGIVAVAAIIALARHRGDRSAWAAACCPGVGLALVMINAYGHEGIFRAALFGVPWLATLAARLFDGPQPGIRTGCFGVMICWLTATFLTASFGLDATNVLRPADRVALEHFHAEPVVDRWHPNYLLNLGAGSLPTSPPHEDHGHVSLDRDALDELMIEERDQRFQDQPAALTVRRLTESLITFAGSSPDQVRLYAIWSPVSLDYARAYGVFRADRFIALRDAFQRSGYWTVALRVDRTVLFRFEPAGYPGARLAGGQP